MLTLKQVKVVKQHPILRKRKRYIKKYVLPHIKTLVLRGLIRSFFLVVLNYNLENDINL